MSSERPSVTKKLKIGKWKGNRYLCLAKFMRKAGASNSLFGCEGVGSFRVCYVLACPWVKPCPPR